MLPLTTMGAEMNQPSANQLAVSPARLDRNNTTGMYVRAALDGKWDSWDIACLEKDSMMRWLRSRGGENEWAEGVILNLLDYPFDPAPSADQELNK